MKSVSSYHPQHFDSANFDSGNFDSGNHTANSVTAYKTDFGTDFDADFDVAIVCSVGHSSKSGRIAEAGTAKATWSGAPS
jgi:hypothetical protein